MNLLDLVKMKDIKRVVKSTEWYHSSVALTAANKFDSVQYNILYSKEKPRNIHPWNWRDNLFIKSGSSSGKGFGMSDDSMTGKFRTNRRKGTSQPKDRLTDHLNILRIIDSEKNSNQREMADNLGISLGKLNFSLNEVKKKGYVKFKNFKKNKNKLNYMYILTPEGISKKTKLLISFMKRKMNEYDELKQEYEKSKNMD